MAKSVLTDLLKHVTGYNKAVIIFEQNHFINWLV